MRFFLKLSFFCFISPIYGTVYHCEDRQHRKVDVVIDSCQQQPITDITYEKEPSVGSCCLDIKYVDSGQSLSWGLPAMAAKYNDVIKDLRWETYIVRFDDYYVRVRVFDDKIFLLRVFYSKHQDERIQLNIISKDK